MSPETTVPLSAPSTPSSIRSTASPLETCARQLCSVVVSNGDLLTVCSIAGFPPFVAAQRSESQNNVLLGHQLGQISPVDWQDRRLLLETIFLILVGD